MIDDGMQQMDHQQEMMDDGQEVEDFAELVKGDIINLYREKSEQAGLQPHDAFI